MQPWCYRFVHLIYCWFNMWLALRVCLLCVFCVAIYEFAITSVCERISFARVLFTLSHFEMNNFINFIWPQLFVCEVGWRLFFPLCSPVDCRLTIELRQFIDTLALCVRFEVSFFISALYFCFFFIEHICVELFAFMHYTFCVAAVIIVVGMHIKSIQHVFHTY